MLDPAQSQPVLAVFLKATVLREVMVPAYTRHDGTVVPAHRKMVHVDPDRPMSDVLSGQGSHSQRQAHRRLSRLPHWHSLPDEDRYHHILSSATNAQQRASQSAALSGWRQAARAGRNPTRSQWQAFLGLEPDRRVAEFQAIHDLLGDTTHLRMPSGTAPAPAPAAAAASAPEPAAASPAAAASNPRDAWSALATEDYQNRGGRLPAPNRPDAIMVNFNNDHAQLTFAFGEGSSRQAAAAWVRGYLEQKGLAIDPGSLLAVEESDQSEDDERMFGHQVTGITVHARSAQPVREQSTAAPAAPAAPARTRPSAAAARHGAGRQAPAQSIRATVPQAVVGDRAVMAAPDGSPQVFFHGGADVASTALNALSFFTTDESIAEGYRQAREGGRTHRVHLQLRNPASGEDIKAAAQAVGVSAETFGMDDDEMLGFEYVSPHLHGGAQRVIDELKRRGFDGAKMQDFAQDGSRLTHSYMVFNSSQIVPAPAAAAQPAPRVTLVVGGTRQTYRLNPDGRWETGSGRAVTHGSGSGIWYAATIMSGAPISERDIHAGAEGARLQAASILVNSGRDPEKTLDVLLPPHNSGPLEGDTRSINGIEYVLRDGRWHRASPGEQAAPAASEPAAAPVAASTARVIEMNGQFFRRRTGGWEVAGSADSPVWHAVRNAAIVSTVERRERRDADAEARRQTQAPAPSVVQPLARPAVDHAAVMAAVPVPDLSDLSSSATNQSTRRRMAQLAALAAAGDHDAVVNFTTSRTRANYARLADYRDALLDAVSRASTTPAHTAAAIAQPLPAAPVISGANPNNSALIAAQRRVRALEEAARTRDPVAAILAVSTTRHNYMRAADDYRTALLAHFGHAAGGGELVSSAEVAAAPTAARQRARRSRAAAPSPAAAPAAASRPVPPSQNPEIAANPYGLSEAELGFVPRPNVPLSVSTMPHNQPRGWVWPHPEMAELNRRYLAQSTALQSRAREYQAGSWVPDTPEIRAAREAREAEERRANAERDREALRRIEQRRASVPDVFRPHAELGANVREVTFGPGMERVARACLGIQNEAELRVFAQTMIADYGTTETFKVQMSSLGADGFQVRFLGNKGTQISRNFSKTANGPTVYHAFFEAGSTGGGSGRHLFRTSMGLYQAYGIKSVSVTANIDVGGYAWARFGYVARDWQTLRAELKRRVESMAAGGMRISTRDQEGNRGSRAVAGISADEKARILQVLASNDPKTVWAVADMKLNGRDIGKELLLGTHWKGDIYLDDPDTMARFTAYVTPRGGA